MHKRLQLFAAVFASLFIAMFSAAYAGEASRSVTAHGLTVHYGIVPASKAANSDRTAASDVGAVNPDTYHLTVAIFDSATGRRLSDATVLASVKGPRRNDTRFHSKPVEKRLDPVKIGNAVTYGNDFEMPWSGIYHVDLTVTQKDQPKPTSIRFNYDHRF
jgi:hypothetical protein